MEKWRAAIQALGITGPELEGMSKRTLGQLITDVRSGERPLNSREDYSPDELVRCICDFIGIISHSKDDRRL